MSRPFRQFLSDEVVFVWIVVLWLGAVFYFDPRLLALLGANDRMFPRIAILLFVGCLDLFWFYTIYYAVMGLTSWRLRQHKESPLPLGASRAKVAILYPTRNDFREASVDRLLKIDHEYFHLFILDDSTLPEYHQRIDSWAGRHTANVTVIRRSTHGGFKAGNLNHGLRQIHQDFEFFAVCDDDGIFPPGFIRDLLPYFQVDPKVAFVQARQDGNPSQPEFFGQAMGYAVRMHYRHYVRARQSYGFVMFYGHGALIRMAAWTAVGGFPEMVTEDLAFSAKLRALGYRGIFTEKVICHEDFPPTYGQLRKRTEKWIRGTAEFLKLGYKEFFKSPHVTWFEKVDVLVHSTTHFMAVPMLLFLLTLGFVLPANFSQFRYPGSFFLMPVPSEAKSTWDYLFHVRYHIFWSLDFYLMMMLTIFSPILPVLLDHWRTPVRLFRYVAASNFVYLGSLVSESCSLLAFIFTGKAFFRNTHDAAREGRLSWRDFFQQYHPNHVLVFVMELLMGSLLAVVCWSTKNLWFLAPACALLASPIVYRFGWERRLVRALTWIPFLIGAIIVGVVTLHLGVTGVEALQVWLSGQGAGD